MIPSLLALARQKNWCRRNSVTRAEAHTLTDDVRGALFALADLARQHGAQELLLGHPNSAHYGFSANDRCYRGSLDSRVCEELARYLTHRRTAHVAPPSAQDLELCLGIMDLSRSVFFISWPVKSVPTDFPSRDSQIAPRDIAHILVLEDELDVATLIAREIERAGFSVTFCTAIEEAESKLENTPHPFDLIVSDLHTPGGNGMQLFRRLRAKGCSLPIIVLTSETDPTMMRDVIDCGIDAYLWKGSPPELLQAWIRNLTDPTRARRFNV